MFVNFSYCIVTLTQWIRYTIILIDIFSTAKIKLHVYIDSFKNQLCYYARQCCCRIQPLLSQKARVCVTITSTPASSYIGNRGDYFREMFEVVLLSKTSSTYLLVHTLSNLQIIVIIIA